VSAFELGQDEIFRCKALEKFPWQQHGFGTRNSQPSVDLTLQQTHSNIVHNAKGLEDRAEEGDALVTDEIGRAVGVRTADCVPILLLDSKKRAVAAVHAGWRGTAAQIVGRTVRMLQVEFGSRPADVYAAIGPCIRQCCYEVGAEVAGQFHQSYFTSGRAPGKWYLNLPAANRDQLLESGIAPTRIFDLEACTVCLEANFFSYRREPQNPGRMIASIQRVA
jgi:polyphenol oxidase